jgi:hypothetical protein
VDYYGLYYITEYAAARKLWALFYDVRHHVHFISISKYTVEEWYDLIGPFIQLTRLTPHNQMNQYIEEVVNKRRDPMIKGSFLQKILFPEILESYII